MKHRFILLLGLVATSVFAAKQPNILYIFADDMAYDTIAAHGHAQIKTPNLDKLVKGGVSFTSAYNMGGYHGAVCVASRTMLNTGVYLWHAQAKEKTLKSDDQANGKLWSQLLGKAGYETYFTGKWHVKADPSTIFTTARNVRGGMPNQTKEGYNRPIDGQPDPWDPTDPKFGGFWKGGTHWSEVVANDGIDYIANAQKSAKPFFMYLAFNAPHDPRQAPKEFVDMYPWEDIKIPEPFYPEYPHNIGIRGIRDEKLAPYPRTPYSVKVNRREYYAIISHMDQQIGRILEALEKSGMKDNTYIFFSADHGLGCGHHSLLGKQNMYEHSVRVPFIVVGPGLEKGKKIDHPIYMQDIMPTSLELAGTEVPERVQFKSLLPVLKEGKASYASIYGAYTMNQRMLRKGDWKLILYPKISKTLLYNLAKDPIEANDLAGNPEHAKRIEHMVKELKAWQPITGDPLDLDQAVAEPEPKKKRKA